jgi:hypothetical protein
MVAFKLNIFKILSKNSKFNKMEGVKIWELGLIF